MTRNENRVKIGKSGANNLTIFCTKNLHQVQKGFLYKNHSEKPSLKYPKKYKFPNFNQQNSSKNLIYAKLKAN
jgi:hypothetical protein